MNWKVWAIYAAFTAFNFGVGLLFRGWGLWPFFVAVLFITIVAFVDWKYDWITGNN